MKHLKDQTLILAGDIGGTKTNLGLFFMGKGRPAPNVIETYLSQEAPHLEQIIDRFVDKHRISITSACFGVAGPVENGRCKTTNLPWEISEIQIKRRFNWEHVRLINDLAATALAIPLLRSREMLSLNKVKAMRGRNLGLVAPGTGLGMALLIWADEGYVPVSSEGGHVDFGPTEKAEVELWQYLNHRLGHVSVERVLSGQGLLNIYTWLKDSGRYQEPAWLAENIKDMDPARAISEAALEKREPLCQEALNIFVSIFGAVAGNLALTGFTTGGIYLGGGIPPKILSKLKEDIFMASFTDKGRFKDFLKRIPVRVILNDKAALLGAAYCAFRMQR
ncbi:MAG: glucokinase [Desulfatiglandales bacterium]